MTEQEAISALLKTARAEIGYHEQGDNITKYATDYNTDTKLYGFDMNGLPWCDYFVDWCFCKTFGFELGSSMTFQYSGCSGASCAASASYYKSFGAWYDSPQIGDQIFFIVSGGINHTGIVEEISDGHITTIEGNSSDQVKRNFYDVRNGTIAGYGRPAWRYCKTKEADSGAGVTADSVIHMPKIAENTLKYGSKGVLVTALQAILNYYGADLTTDGDLGKLSRQALIDYQSTHKDADGKPLEADGICGEKTWRSF